jgi:hypothetical protein
MQMKKYYVKNENGDFINDKEVYEFLRKEYPHLNTVYNDRMRQWDYDKYRKCVEQVFGPNMGDYLPEDEEKISELLTLYHGTPMRCCVIEYHEDARGFPLWRIDFQYLDENGEVIPNKTFGELCN